MPFAGYRDFADCVKRNRDKDNPEAYCAAIMRKVEHPRDSSAVVKVKGRKYRVKYRKS